jgi:cell pole-organizing protein PopZ
MEDILASIRRILSEDEPVAENPAQAPAAQPAEKDVLVLDPSMMVHETKHDNDVAEHEMAQEAEPQHAAPEPVPPPAASPPAASPQAASSSPAAFAPSASAPAVNGGGLVAPEAASAAANAVGQLVRTLTERSTQVHSGGPTIEDVVRDEIRPILKQWLDTNLPPLVERLVRIEIERVVGRAVP